MVNRQKPTDLVKRRSVLVTYTVLSLELVVYVVSYHVTLPRYHVTTYLPENQYQHYHLRQRLHNKALILKTTYLSVRDYIMRMLYKNCY